MAEWRTFKLIDGEIKEVLYAPGDFTRGCWCSNCKVSAPFMDNEFYASNYCPHCGEPMKQGETKWISY